MPGVESAGMPEKKASNAARPPAEAPIPTIGKASEAPAAEEPAPSSTGTGAVRESSADTPALAADAPDARAFAFVSEFVGSAVFAVLAAFLVFMRPQARANAALDLGWYASWGHGA